MNAFARYSIALLALSISACKKDAAPQTNTSPPPMTSEPDCGADRLAAYIGQTATEAVMAAIRKDSGASNIRVIGPDTAVTMDYRPDRLNVAVDISGKIESFRCT